MDRYDAHDEHAGEMRVEGAHGVVEAAGAVAAVLDVGEYASFSRAQAGEVCGVGFEGVADHNGI